MQIKRHRIDNTIIEVNLTNHCNLSCSGCANSCSQAPDDGYMSIDQIEKFIDEMRQNHKGLRRIKLVGGEPTLHPQFNKILELFLNFRDGGVYKNPIRLLVLTNGVGSDVNTIIKTIPKGVGIRNSTKRGMKHKLSVFESINEAPCDLERYKSSDFSNGCWRTTKCGICISPSGYYVCNPAYHIDRVFGYNVGIMSWDECTEERFRRQTEIMCRVCGLFQVPRNYTLVVSDTWKEAYSNYHNEGKPTLGVY